MHAPRHNNREIFTTPLYMRAPNPTPECKVQGWSNSYFGVVFVVLLLSAYDGVAKFLCGWLSRR